MSHITGTRYMSGMPKKASEEWPSEWFYIDDVALSDPVRMGLPEFSRAPLKKRHSWRPRSPQEEDNREVLYLMGRIKMLAKSGLTIIEVMSICIMRGVQPLQYRGHPLWCYNGADDATCCGRKGPDNAAALAKILSELFKGEEEEFTRMKPRDGFSMYNPPSWVSYISLLPFFAAFFVVSIHLATLRQELRKAIKEVSSPSPQPEDPGRALDSGLEEDPVIFVELIDRQFYQLSCTMPWWPLRPLSRTAPCIARKKNQKSQLQN